MIEADIERSCRLYAAGRRVMSRKLAHNITGDPDRVFLLPHGRVWLVEFKTPRGRLSPRQVLSHREFLQHGHSVTVIRSVEQFKQALDWLLKEQ